MSLCEYCSKKIFKLYASGRFCNKKCACGFSTKLKRKEINQKVSKKLSFGSIKKSCEYCKKHFILKKSHSNIKTCSRFCMISLLSLKNKGRKFGTEFRKKRSESVKKQYKDGRKIYGGKTKWFSVETSNGLIKVQGTYEVRVCKILDYLKTKKKINDWEYTKDRFLYKDLNGIEHSYLVDFKIFENNGKFWYLECKGFASPNDKIKWMKVEKLGFKIKVWFEKDIKKYEKISK